MKHEDGKSPKHSDSWCGGPAPDDYSDLGEKLIAITQERTKEFESVSEQIADCVHFDL